MTPITRYQCDVCKLEHETEESAVKCESSKVEMPSYKDGDEVVVLTRYNGPAKHIYKGTRIVPTTTAEYSAQDGPEMIARAKELKLWDSVEFHEWIVIIEKEEQIGKDYYSREIGPCNVMRRIRLQWAGDQDGTSDADAVCSIAVTAFLNEIQYSSLVVDWDTLSGIKGVQALMTYEDLELHHHAFAKHRIGWCDET